MKDKENNEAYQKVRERAHIIPIIGLLNVHNENLLELTSKRPDFGLAIADKYIGIEVTEVRPHKYHNTMHIVPS